MNPLACLVTFVGLAVLLPFTQAQGTLGSNFTLAGTVELTGVSDSTVLDNTTSAGLISGSVLDVTCLLLVRQKGKWNDQNSGKSGTVVFGPYVGSHTVVANNFQNFGIPNGALIDPILDVSAAPDIDLDLWFTVDYSTPCVAQYTCTGSVFRYVYKFTGVTCGSVSGTSSPTPTSPPAPSGSAIPKFGQCGGTGWTGPTACVAGTTCTVLNPFFSQCM